MNASPQITELLVSWREGDEGAKDQLFQAMYSELRQLAHQQRRQWRGNHTMNTTALVHELYIKLEGQSRIQARDRAHFNLIAGKALRHILVDYAKKWRRQKRGGDAPKLSLDDAPESALLMEVQVDEVLGIDRALTRLGELNERLVQVVEMHFFGGFTYEEVAAALGVSKKTVSRDWTKARAWLRQELQPLDHTPDRLKDA